ncbi:hypothetical protein EDB81DRAFT_764144 [Dactylonectria macrodidyma]|uniref:RNase H type-1 domain-containing protein n=1 Tax=Dactylonectria macrodidyma TaxID=307937 RepID=A0A9P9E308_9HYPO|nr:hypothetical protein EDB81DRAFT_764144 [Dactylonectria macrodidyma]
MATLWLRPATEGYLTTSTMIISGDQSILKARSSHQNAILPTSSTHTHSECLSKTVLSTFGAWTLRPTHPHTDRMRVMSNSMIIAFSGACPGNGTHQAVASGCGVYFGPRGPNCLDIQQNLSSEVPDHHFYQHTKQRAELHATIAGLKSATKFATDREQWPYARICDDLEQWPIYHLVIMSDS